jgi:hypothetical protein
VKWSTFSLFVRQRADEPSFRRCLQALAQRWANAPGVLRVRLSLFEVPDMEAERKAGYPVKTHPPAQHVREIHAYPVLHLYTSVYAGHPTLVGLRGWPAWDAIQGLDARNACAPELLEWMYGPVARGAHAEDGSRAARAYRSGSPHSCRSSGRAAARTCCGSAPSSVPPRPPP